MGVVESGNIIQESDTVCPYCKEKIMKDAIKCKHCGATLKSKYKDFISSGTLKAKKILSEKKFSVLLVLLFYPP